MYIKNKHQALQKQRIIRLLKRKEKEKQQAIERDYSSYTPQKRRQTCVRTLPDAEVAVSRCGLVVQSFTKYKINKKIYYYYITYNLEYIYIRKTYLNTII